MGSLYHSLVETVFRKIYGQPFNSRPFVSARDHPEDYPNLGAAPTSVDNRCSGLVMMADGVGGLDLCGTALRYVLGALGSNLEVCVVPWGHGLGRWHADLTRVANRDAWARRMAAAAEHFRQQRPDAPIYLVAKSGGSGVVIKALELLPADSVERAVLLAPALSPRYDLTSALRAVRRELYVFWSPLDFVILGAGTRIFGTIDRSRTISAGLVGFRHPVSSPLIADRLQSREGSVSAERTVEGYQKLRQIRWRASMMSTGYFGGHLGPDSPAFLRKYVAPLLRADSPAGC